MLFMLQDMAVPDVLMHDLPRILARKSRATGIAHGRGQFGQVELHHYCGHFHRVIAHRFLPAQLVVIGRPGRTCSNHGCSATNGIHD